MGSYFYIIVGILGTMIVGILLKVAQLIIRDSGFESSARVMSFLDGNDVRIELKSDNKTINLRSFLDPSLVYVEDRKVYPYAVLKCMPFSSQIDSLTDVGIDKDRHYFLSFPPHSQNSVILPFTRTDDGPSRGSTSIYISCFDPKGKRVYAPVNLAETGFQKLTFKKKNFKIG